MLAINVMHVTVIISLMHNFFLTLYHSIKLLHFNFKNRSIPTRLEVISILTMLIITSFTLSLTLLTFDLYPKDIINCTWQVAISYGLYMTAKGALFYLFLERLIAVFANSTLKFSNKFIITTRVCISLFIISIYLVIIFAADGLYNTTMNQCVTADGKWSKCM